MTTRSRSTSQSQTMSPEPVTASAWRSMSLNRPWCSAPPAKACCMTVKPIRRMIRIRPPPSAGWTMSLSSMPVIVIHDADQPDQHHHPARHQHDRAVVAAGCRDRRSGRCRRSPVAAKEKPRDAGRDRRIEDRDAGDQDQAEHPDQRAIAEMAVPSVEVEIGEQEHHEGRRQRRPRCRRAISARCRAMISMTLLRKPKSTQI